MIMAIRPLDEALLGITDGCMLAVPREVSGVAMAATRALIRRRVKRLHVVALPTSSLQADLLIGAGCVETLETSAVSMGEFGPAPRFTAAMLAGSLRMKDATCPAIYASMEASVKGVPFMPLRGLIGSDLVAHRPDWKTIGNPYGDDDPIVLLPAIKPDVALFHAPMADKAGNVWIGAHARSRDALLCVGENNRDGRENSTTATCSPIRSWPAGTCPAFYIEAVAIRRKRRRPGRLRCPTIIPPTARTLADYVIARGGRRRASTVYLDEYCA
jgi:glutaconate CoA-transferase subunit A